MKPFERLLFLDDLQRLSLQGRLVCVLYRIPKFIRELDLGKI